MPIKVKTILEEIARRELKGSWEFKDSDGFTRYLGGDYRICGTFSNYLSPDSIAEEVVLSSAKEPEKSDLYTEIRKGLALEYSLEIDRIYGNFEVIAKEDAQFLSGFSRLEQAEKAYSEAIRNSARMLIRRGFIERLKKFKII